ncbi:endoglucanase Acf2 [Crossiella equi]|uniref:glucan endo-1,3-beta-D-glucosidase n=1 Tax=Crossiella equi TaxID=130796 RepID=A0ABS5A513_9PSEU|nr:glycosyl hydrolase [Crossiella equi]MBP2471673.1 endoglucanase Acf2 [Crossiella equi]
MSVLSRVLAAATAALTLGVVVPVAVTVGAGSASAEPIGAGSYTTTLPAGAALPSGCGDLSTNPRRFITANAPSGAVPTNDWWSSLVFKRNNCAYSDNLMAHPFSFNTSKDGLGVDYATNVTVSGTATGVGEYHYPYSTDFTLGVTGLNAPEVKVDGWTDWTVSPVFSDGTRTLRTTIGHGSPYVYARVTGGDARLGFPGAAPSVWLNSGATIGFTSEGHDYVAYAPTGAGWSVGGGAITSNLAGRGYFTVAVLPTTPSASNADRQALATSYGRHAHAHVTGTRVSWTYDQAASTVRATYTATTQAMEGGQSGTAFALYPHQWRNLSGGSPIAQTYVSPRGALKTLVGVSSFTTAIKYHGVLPELPQVGMTGADLNTLNGYLNEASAGDPFAGFNNDTYWTGKALGRAARMVEIADQVGNLAVRDKLLGAIRARLTDWFTAPNGKAERVFYYDRNWGALTGYPASYGSDTDLNDHHFHYGYYIAAAATLAKFDPAWAAPNQYGGMVDLLIRDANGYNRSDTMFPFLRDFDIYAGHDWAAGHGAFFAGNNQESSSEGMNFANALIQWGQATGNTAARDAGLHIYTTQGEAIKEYWFDTTDTNFPSQFQHSTVGMVWGDGGAYSTWFSAEPEMIQGINMLPITGGSLYLGHDPAYIQRNLRELVTNNGGPPTVWRDIIWSFQALSQPDQALSEFRTTGYTVEEGETKARTFQWLRNLAALGQVDRSVTANHPLHAVFTKGGARTYVATNIGAQPLTVTFSDGRQLVVQPGKTATTGAITWSGGNGSGGLPTSSSTTPTTTTTTSTPPPVGGNQFFVNSPGALAPAESSGARTDSVAGAGGANNDGTPRNALTYTVCGLSGSHDASRQTQFSLFLDAGTSVGNGVQARVSYDFTGSGQYSRVETYRYFATDPVTGWENYSQAAGQHSATGSFAALRNGCVKLEVWSAIGNAATSLRVNATAAQGQQSKLGIPFNS